MKPFVALTAVFVLAAGSPLFAEDQLPPLPGPTVSANAVSTYVGPRIQFAEPVHDFGRVMAGEVVKYEFIFTNTGDALLEISGVHAGCGCTTPGTWTRQVEPGKTGTVPLQFNTGNFMGPVAKSATVISTDKKQPTTMVQLKGTIWKPIDVSPQTVVLTVVPDSTSNAPAVVKVVCSLDYPVILSDPRSSNQVFAVEVKTNQLGKDYQLLISVVPPLQNAAQGIISVNTSCTNLPVINVTAIASVQPALVVMPPQIMLPAVFPSNAIPFTISIRNNSATPMTLSDPAFSAKDVELQLKEISPGRQYTATLTFPPGFEADPAANLEFTVKTSNPQNPLVRVPVRQMQRPAQRAALMVRPGPVAAGPVPGAPPMPNVPAVGGAGTPTPLRPPEAVGK